MTVLPTHCGYCGRELDRVPVRHGFDTDTGRPDVRFHLRCPEKVTSSWQAILHGDWHDETIEPSELGPFSPGDPGPILLEVKWR